MLTATSPVSVECRRSIPASGCATVTLPVTVLVPADDPASGWLTVRSPVLVLVPAVVPASACPVALVVSVPVGPVAGSGPTVPTAVPADLTASVGPVTVFTSVPDDLTAGLPMTPPVEVPDALTIAPAFGVAPDRPRVTSSVPVSVDVPAVVESQDRRPRRPGSAPCRTMRPAAAGPSWVYAIRFVANPAQSQVQTPEVPGLIDRPAIKARRCQVSNPEDTPDCPYAGWTARPVAASACVRL
jgi:hypothetical protein